MGDKNGDILRLSCVQWATQQLLAFLSDPRLTGKELGSALRQMILSKNKGKFYTEPPNRANFKKMED